jgi:Fic family protein
VFLPMFQRTDKLVALIAQIEVSRDRILRSGLVPHFRATLRRAAAARGAHQSARMEGSPLSLGEVTSLLYGLNPPARPRHRQMVVNYGSVRRYIDKDYRDPLRPISEETIKTLHRILARGILPPGDAGQYRTVPFELVSPTSGSVLYEAPDWQEAPVLTADLAAWLGSARTMALMPVLKAGIAHHELARIHPFVDGNGSTARALATLVLCWRGFDTQQIFALDGLYTRDVLCSFDEELRMIDPRTLELTDWLEHFVESIAAEVKRVERRVEGKSRRQLAATPLGTISLNLRQMKLMKVLRQTAGETTQGDYEEVFLVSKATATHDLAELARLGLVVSEGIGTAARYRLAPHAIIPP